MSRLNLILGRVSSSTSGKKYEVALEVDEFDRPQKWITGPGKGQLRIHCGCRSMINRTGVDERGNCKHIRALLGYESTSAKLNRRSRNLLVEELAHEDVVRAWGT